VSSAVSIHELRVVRGGRDVLPGIDLEVESGTAFGLFVSAFARTEFQAVQLLPAFVLPQLLLCGLFIPRDDMASWLHWISDVLPVTYAFDALSRAARSDSLGARFAADLAVTVGATLLALVLGAATLRRRTP
jgi:ABC-2 type transport system permease protein